MLEYPIYKLINRVPICLERVSLATVLEIFKSKKCDRLVILNDTQQPIGLLYAARLLPQLLLTSNSREFLNLQLPLSSLDKSLITAPEIIKITDNLEHLKSSLQYLATVETSAKNNLDWTIVNEERKFLGLLNINYLLELLICEKTPRHEKPQVGNQLVIKQPINAAIVNFLNQLPWPLMLQNSQGKVIIQNPAWWHQLGISKDPEALKQEIESLLTPIYNQYSHPQSLSSKIPASDEMIFSKNIQKKSSPSLKFGLPLLQEPPHNLKITSNRCTFDNKEGICTCIVEINNGQEQIWQFAKVPLNSNLNSNIWHPENYELDILDITEEDNYSQENMWLILATDITEQQQLCQELAAKNADLIQLNRLKDEFLSCISHELKTPLTAVLGLSRLLVDQQLGQLNERQARYAELIHQSGRHLMSVVNDILDLTRMETGQMELTLTPVNIHKVCERALLEVENIYNQINKNKQISQPGNNNNISHQQFTLVIESELEEMIADELRLRQMLVHLISNAFKFTEISGEVGLKVNRWEGWIAFTVWDTGIGIPEHQQHLIFQKFQQLENPLTRQFEGTGLGLVLTRALARLHGGDVSFLSREGKGSQFTLLLPPHPSQTMIKNYQKSEESSGEFSSISEKFTTCNQHQNQPIFSPRLVLIVEAVARYIEDLTEHLKGLGYRVVIARSGTEALEKARRLQPQFIFLNPLLPLLSGWDVLTLLKSDLLTRHIQVIVTATAAEKEQAATKKADGFLNLPVKYELLSSLLKDLTTLQLQTAELENEEIFTRKVPLRILRLVNAELDTIELYPSLREHRVIEVDDLEQADLLTRVWQFDVVLLDIPVNMAQSYLDRFPKYPKLLNIPLVTCDIATTLMASQIPGLSVFPCLSLLNHDKSENKQHQESKYKQDTLSSVLQIAAGICSPINILVVDLNMVDDLSKNVTTKITTKKSRSGNVKNQRGSHWFQALVQYLKTAGFQANIAVSWLEVLQQVSHQTVDLLLIYLGENDINREMKKAIDKLANLPFNLPPILIIDQAKKSPIDKNVCLEGLVNVLTKRTGNIATQVLPRSVSMEDLLIKINQCVGVKQDER
ncbi:ATP-binding protein [Anabaena sp. FACHB-1237]|uniref:ATP-binding response regulator n=1 Tax=Anabaena sp. FACHB-1237 TaxID=2692769 RepID=UPI0028C49AD3|nr:ATP-binding protein [Anabaena sp. FACHB-1237]